MRKSLLVLSALLLLPLFAGCGGKADEGGEMKTTAPVNNNAPAAKTAPGAPSNPSIIYPGQAKGKTGQ